MHRDFQILFDLFFRKYGTVPVYNTVLVNLPLARCGRWGGDNPGNGLLRGGFIRLPFV